jgi:hypothetical protein
MTDKTLVAPCGMNCSICSSYLAQKNALKNKGIKKSYCAGCRKSNKKCAFLKKRCSLLLGGKIKYCFLCRDFPCKRLKHLDERYRTYYRMSMIENLEFIKKNGIAKFLKKEEKKWQCKACGGSICCHNGLCFECDLGKLKEKKNRYRWEGE